MNRRGTEPYARWCERTAGVTPPPTQLGWIRVSKGRVIVLLLSMTPFGIQNKISRRPGDNIHGDRTANLIGTVSSKSLLITDELTAYNDGKSRITQIFWKRP
jgi:hypothetical protein